MITQYFRPQTMEEALHLLSRPDTRPLGGGTLLTQSSVESFSVVDLQALGLANLKKSGDRLEIGATVTLQSIPASAAQKAIASEPRRPGNRSASSSASLSTVEVSPRRARMYSFTGSCWPSETAVWV